jgi:hypothetical protein
MKPHIIKLTEQVLGALEEIDDWTTAGQVSRHLVDADITPYTYDVPVILARLSALEKRGLAVRRDRQPRPPEFRRRGEYCTVLKGEVWPSER